MVIATAAINTWAVIAEDSAPLLQRLDPVTRTKVLMALLGLVLLGITMIACVMIGGRWVRRLAQHKPRTAAIEKSAKWGTYRKASSIPVTRTTGDTLMTEQQTDETVTD
jgi:hypothetical protein